VKSAVAIQPEYGFYERMNADMPTPNSAPPVFSKTMMLVWPLLIGMCMIMVGNGLQGTLLALRAELDGFAIAAIGIIMSMYYCGYLAGWFIVPRMIKSVGHIRVFAGFASLASTTVLIQGLFVDPYLWSIVRFASGLSFVGLFIVAESWLNNIAPNKLRGQILSSYIFVINGGLFAGQFLINIGSIETMGLFVLVSVLISLSLVPVTLANKATPGFEEVENLPLKKLIKTSPLAVMCVLACGFMNAGMLGIGPVFAQNLGLDIAQISFLMASYVFGCAAVPLGAGWVSDRLDRRKVIISLCFIGLIFSLWLVIDTGLIYACALMVGGCSTAIYSIGAAMMNDRLKTSQMTSATASLILVNGVGACISPILLGVLMQTVGLGSFFSAYCIVFAASFAFGLYRNFTGPEINVEDQGDFQNIPARSGAGVAAIIEDDEQADR
jgi:MFS family permease